MNGVRQEGDLTIISANTTLGEGPLWCRQTQSLLWIDGSRPQLLRWRWGSDRSEAWEQPRPPAALAHMADGRLLVAFRERFGITTAPDKPVRNIALPGLALGDERFNDAKVDRSGRLWIGTIDRALTRRIGCVRRFDSYGIEVMAGGFGLSNGMGWSPDDRSFYFSESLDRQVYRFHFDPTRGEIKPSGILATFQGGVPKPDGLTVDSEGGIWCVVFGGGVVHRFWPDGRLDRTIYLPVSHPTSCTFGGPDLKTLFVTTATHGLSREQAALEPDAGSLLALSIEVAGLPETPLSSDNVLARAPWADA